MITSVALRMCRGHIYVLGQPLWQLWQRSPALLSFPQCDVRTLLQYNPCLSTSQALCRLGGGLRPRWWRKASAGRDSFPPGSVYIFYNNVCCPQTTWLSYQCKEQLNPHSAECFHYSYSWSWHSRPSALWSSLLFHYWLIYTLNRDSKEVSFCVSTVITWEWLPGTPCWERFWGYILTQQDEALWLIGEVCHRWGWGVSSTHICPSISLPSTLHSLY